MTIRLFGGRLLINAIFFPVAAIMCWINGMDHMVAFLLALILHESAHGIMASAVGVRVERLEVMPFGCMAQMESFACIAGGKEVAMAAAGPAANLIMAAACFLWGKTMSASPLQEAFLQSNITLAAMNLLPALPLDGGRIVSVVLGLVMPQLRAVKITSILGICIGVLMVGLGGYLYVTGVGNPTLLVMGGFLIFSAARYLHSGAFTFLRKNAEKRMQIRNRPTVEVKNIAAHESKTFGEVLTNMDTRKYNILHILDDKMNVVRKLDEGEIIQEMMKSGTMAQLRKQKKWEK